MKHDSKDGHAEVCCLTGTHARDLEHPAIQYELFVSDHHRGVRSFRQLVKDTEKAIANIEHCHVAQFTRQPWLNKELASRSLSFAQLLEEGVLVLSARFQ